LEYKAKKIASDACLDANQTQSRRNPPEADTGEGSGSDGDRPDLPPPACLECGRPMARRKARSGQNAGDEFWGCSGYLERKGVRTIEEKGNR